MSMFVRAHVILVGMAVCGQELAAQVVPDMTIPRLSYAEHLKEKKVTEVIVDYDRRILEGERNGTDVSALRAEQQKYWDEYAQPFCEPFESEELTKLKREILFPTIPEVFGALDDPDPAKAQKLVDTLYRDFGNPLLNFTNYGGIVLPVLQELATRELDDETRRVLVEGVSGFVEKGVEQLVNADELRACDLAPALYRLAGPDDERALNAVQLLYGRALARVRATGYKDFEEEITRSMESTLDILVDDNGDALAASGGDPTREEPASVDDLKAARRDFRLAIRNPILRERAARVLGHLQRDWGSPRVNAEMERSYMQYGLALLRLLHSPPPRASASTLDECKSLFNRGMVELTRRDLGQTGWGSWGALGIRMPGIASPELRQAISERIASLGPARGSERALKTLTTVQSALRVDGETAAGQGSTGGKPGETTGAEGAARP